MSRPLGKITQHIPEKLRQMLAEESGLDLSVQKFIGQPYKELYKKLDAFIRNDYNKTNKPNLPRTNSTNIYRALFASETDKGIGFSKVTAEILCRYATKGQMGWDAFVEQNPKIREEYIFPNEISEKNPVQASSKTPPNKILADYLNHQLDKFEFIYLDIDKDRTKIPIKNVKLPLLTYYKGPEFFEKNEYNKEHTDDFKKTLDIKTELQHTSKMLVIGDGGIGKTSFCKCLFYQYAKEYIDRKNSIFPIYIDLHREESFSTVVIENIGRSKITLNDGIEFLQEVTPLLIFDGLDELSDNNINAIKEIKRSVNYFTNCKVLITTRECDNLRDFTSNGFGKYSIEKTYNEELPKLLIKDQQLLRDFKQHSETIILQYQNYIATNNLLHTFFILNFLTTKGESTNTGEILKSILEYYYIKNWELSDKKNRISLPESSKYILDPLSALAIVSDYPQFFSYNARSGTTYHRNIRVRIISGISHQCLINIIKLCSMEQNIDSEGLIKFYCESGMLIYLANGNYKFSNRYMQDYFLARGLTEFCFSFKTPDQLPFDSNTLESIKTFFIRNDSRARGLVIGLINEPERISKNFYKNIPNWKLLLNPDYVRGIGFATQLINRGEKNGAKWKIKNAIALQLRYGIKHYPKLSSYRLWEILGPINPLNINDFLVPLLNIGDESVFNAIFDYYKVYYKEINPDI